VPYSYVQYPGNGSTTSFTVTFPYLLRAHVKLYYGLSLQSGGYTQLLVDGVNYNWVNSTTVLLTAAPANGVTLTVRRETPTDSRLVDWSDGSGLIADNLDTADLQNFYSVQEQKDYVDALSINPSTNVADLSITANKLSSDAVTLAKLIDGVLAASAAGLAKMADGFLAATTAGRAKMADGYITTDKVLDGAVTSAKIADGTIATADLADGAVTSAKIADGTIATADLADSAVTSAKIADGTVATADLADGAVTSAKIADGTIATADLADGAVTSAKLAAGAAVPIGAVFYFAANTSPSGYLKANGDTIPNGNGTVQGITADFSNLYAIIGSTYGAAGKLPDLRGEFLRGWDDSRGVDAGRSFGSAQADEFKSHTHSLYYIPNGSVTGSVYSTGGGSWQYGNTGATGGTETRPRNIALLACIKY
jgi:microcystin-dependent protein